jgi:DNA invertase Pin-like site-specific DNA recombinase
MLIGYARVSTDDQNLELQLAALKGIGCDRIFQDAGVSGKVAKRPGLGKALAALKRGDTLVVWRLDRLGRSLSHLIETIGMLEKRSVHFRSLTETIDTSSSGGRLVFHLMGAMAEFEHALISERTDPAHLAFQEVNSLRQLVEPRAP